MACLPGTRTRPLDLLGWLYANIWSDGFKYWENRGFSNIGNLTNHGNYNGHVYGQYNESQQSEKDALIDDLHSAMGTTNDSNGMTVPYFNDIGILTAMDNFYGYFGKFDASVNHTELLDFIEWSDVTSEIDASRPFILTLVPGNFYGPWSNLGASHSVAVWGYDVITDPLNKYLVCYNTWTSGYEDTWVVFGDWNQLSAFQTKIQPKITLTMNPVTDGSLNPGSGNHGYHYGDKVNIVATPNSGHIFSHWNLISGNGTIQDVNSASSTVTLNGDCTISAIFSGSSNPTVGIQILPVNKLDLLLSWFRNEDRRD